MSDLYPYKAMVAKPGEAGEIRDFYANNRPDTVYLRTEKAIADSVERGLFFIVRDQKDPRKKIVAGSAIYILDDGQKIDCEITEGGQVVRGSAAELASVLKLKELPGGFHGLLFSMPELLFFQALQTSRDLSARYLFAEVHRTRDNSTLTRLIGHRSPTPLAWKFVIKPAPDLNTSFGGSVDPSESNFGADKDILKGSPADLYEISRYFRRVVRFGLPNNRDNTNLPIDMSDLVNKLTVSWTNVGERVTLADQFRANRTLCERYRRVDIGWSDAAETFGRDAKNPGDPIRGINHGYHSRNYGFDLSSEFEKPPVRTGDVVRRDYRSVDSAGPVVNAA